MSGRIEFLLLLIIFFSCKKPQERACLKSAGKIVSQHRELQPFKTIRLEGDINLFLKQDSFYDAYIESPENLIDFISTRQEGDTLFIKDLNRCNWMRNYKYKTNIYLMFSELSRVYFAGTGKIISEDTLHVNRFSIAIDGGSGSINLILNAKMWTYCNIWSGSADVTVSGNTKRNQLRSAGTGVLYFDGLIASYVKIESNGTGDVYVNASDSMDVEINHIGSVYYKGNAVINNQALRGEGKLVKIQ